MRSDAFVVNRVHAAPAAEPNEAQIAESMKRLGVELGEGAPARIERAVKDEVALATRDAMHLSELDAVRKRLAPTASELIRVNSLPTDVHDVRTLAYVAGILTA
jgi:hypothetical protein